MIEIVYPTFEAFASMVSGNFKGDVVATRRDLIDYCKMDTLAMVEVWRRMHG